MPDIPLWRYEYSERLHAAAERWGLAVLPGRPLVGLPYGNEDAGIVGNPYQPKMAQPVEIIDLDFKRSRCRAVIHLFTFNDRWGFSLNLTNYAPNSYEGYSYGNWISSSDPFPDRDSAVLGAADEMLTSRLMAAAVSDIAAWRASLTAPKQLSLFG